MRRQVCADGVGVSGVEVQGRHSRETEVLDEPLRRVEADVTERDLIVAAFRQETGNQGSDLSSTQDEHTMHGRPHFNQYTPALAGCGKTILARENFEGIRTCGITSGKSETRGTGKGSRFSELRTPNFRSRASTVGEGLPRNMRNQHRREGLKLGPTGNSLNIPTRADR
jgi:hypothetical protein